MHLFRLQFRAERSVRHAIAPRISYRTENQAPALFVDRQEFGQIGIGMFQRIQPLSLFLRAMLVMTSRNCSISVGCPSCG